MPLFLLLTLLLSGCGNGPAAYSDTLYAMDTVMELTAYGDEEAVTEGAALIRRLEGALSAQREDSPIWQANHSGGVPVTLPEEAARLLEETLALCREVEGALDVTIYPVMEAWGFPTQDYRVPGEEERVALLARVDYGAVELAGDRLTVPQDMALDLGAVGKGYTGDAVLALWRDRGVESGLLTLGGNVQCLGGKPDGSDWTVAVRHPSGTGYLATVTGRDMAVVTSGGYQRNFTEDGVLYHHIMDPATAAPAQSGLQSVTIVGGTGFLCDGLSTAVYVMGLERAADLWRARRDFEMILYTDDGRLVVTEGLRDRLTPAEGLTAEFLG